MTCLHESTDYTQEGLGGNNNHHQLQRFSYVSLGGFLYVHKLVYSPQLPYKETEAGRGEVIVPGSMSPKWLSWVQSLSIKTLSAPASECRNRGIKRSMSLNPPTICQPILCLSPQPPWIAYVLTLLTYIPAKVTPFTLLLQVSPFLLINVQNPYKMIVFCSPHPLWVDL